jgi:transcription antitermination factor NusG
MNVEFALHQAGVEYYFPVEMVSKIHHRTGKLIDKRFPLIPGYAFIPERNDYDWKALSKIDYIACAVRSKDGPLRIRGSDIDRIRAAEDALMVKYHYDKAVARQRAEAALHRLTSREARLRFPEGSRIKVLDSHAMFGGKEARVLAATGRGTITAMIEMLSGAVKIELGVDYLEDAA